MYELELKFKQLRIEKDVTIAKVAKKLNVNWHTISNLEENKKKTIDLELLKKLCAYYNVKYINQVISLKKVDEV